MNSIIIRLITFFTGIYVGHDSFGNRYYEGRVARRYNKKRRWVIFKGEVEASKITPVWFNWLHYQTDVLPTVDKHKYVHAWRKQYLPNLTGTKHAYYPPGHILSNQDKHRSVKDYYQKWQP